MIQTAHFRIDPRLAMLLGETYRSTEHALKELIDNAWDADAENVWVSLPEPMSTAPIIIRDDGIGMDEREVRREYLTVARDRRHSRGDRSAWKSRRIKGRKGIGKFAGLMAADVMQMETRAAGTATYLTIPRRELLAADKDLPQFELLITTTECNPSDHGTTITLSELNQNLSFPAPERLRELLMLEYGREEGFTIHVNGVPLDMEHLPGVPFEYGEDLPEVGPVRLRFKIVDGVQKLKTPGVAIRVGGKIVGKPGYFGIDQTGDFPASILRQVHGELEADGLSLDTTPDWGSFIENSKAFRIVESWAGDLLTRELVHKYRQDLKLTHSRLKRDIARRLAAMPEQQRAHATEVMDRLLLRSYGLSVERLKPIIAVVLDALEGIPGQ